MCLIGYNHIINIDRTQCQIKHQIITNEYKEQYD